MRPEMYMNMYTYMYTQLQPSCSLPTTNHTASHIVTWFEAQSLLPTAHTVSTVGTRSSQSCTCHATSHHSATVDVIPRGPQVLSGLYSTTSLAWN